MKVLISTDIEGVAGVFHAEQVRPGNGEYERARAWMTGEANAAIAGAIAGGAEEVLVNDSHGGFRNLLPDQLDERARLALSGHDGRARGVLRRGVHDRLPLALAGPRVLAHTINSFAFARVFINGTELGEAGLYGALAGELGCRWRWPAATMCSSPRPAHCFPPPNGCRPRSRTGRAAA